MLYKTENSVLFSADYEFVSSQLVIDGSHYQYNN